MKPDMRLTRHTRLWCIWLVVSFGISGCRRIDRTNPTTTITDEDIHAMGREIGLNLPRTSQLIGVSRDRGGPDNAVFVKVEMSAADWTRVLLNAPFRATELAPEYRGYLGADHDWWDPGRPANLRAVQKPLANGRVLNVGVDDASKPGRVVVYIMNFST